MKRVIIMRGVPGSGKSIEAKSFCGSIVSATDFFMFDGIYNFDPSKLDLAHTDCMRKFLALLNVNTKTVVVDNTNIHLFEVTPYRLVAKAMGYEVAVVRMTCNPFICAKRNIHGVSLLKIKSMLAQYERMPAFLGGERDVYND